MDEGIEDEGRRVRERGREREPFDFDERELSTNATLRVSNKPPISTGLTVGASLSESYVEEEQSNVYVDSSISKLRCFNNIRSEAIVFFRSCYLKITIFVKSRKICFGRFT